MVGNVDSDVVVDKPVVRLTLDDFFATRAQPAPRLRLGANSALGAKKSSCMRRTTYTCTFLHSLTMYYGKACHRGMYAVMTKLATNTKTILMKCCNYKISLQ